MKTVRFVRELNTVNEYTSSSYDDATGEYISIGELLELIDTELGKLDDEFIAATNHQEECCIAQQVKSLVNLRNIVDV